MLIHYSPQRSDRTIAYSFSPGDRIAATLDGQTDTFDFSALPDGEAAEIVSTLDPCPVLSARRVNGRLEVTLLRFHGPNPTAEEAFPPDEEV
ncbi:MAG: hypothetical protein ACM3XZ_02700 [Betaproteobacteria bacterium]